METLLTYFIKVSVLVSLFYVAYWLLLKKETFFAKNRLFLVLGLVTALALPLISITKTVWVESEPSVYQEPIFVPFDEFDSETTHNLTLEEAKTEINWSYIVAGFYLLGVLFFFSKFILSSLSLYKILHKTPTYKQNGYKFIDNKSVKTPFSFFNYIAFDSSSFSKDELENIITHEKVHSNQKHSIDVLLSELILILFWLNPFVWLYRKAILQNLEFIADSKAINSTENRVNYQKTLLKITLNPERLTLANPFYQPLIKKRIMMLNKNKSRKINLLKYAFILPILAVFVLQFQTKVVAQTKQPTTKEIVYQGKQGESALITADTVVWIKDFAEEYEDEMANEFTEETVVVKGGSWEDVEEHLKPKSENNLGKKPLYIINGKEISDDVLKTLNIETLEFDGEVAFTQYSEQEAVEKFGEKAKDGAVVIQAKNVNLKMESSTTDQKELLRFLKTVKDYKQIDIYNRFGNLVYSLGSKEKLDEKKLNALEDGSYFYTFEKTSGEKVSGTLYKGEISPSEQRIKQAQERAKQAEIRAKKTQERAKKAEERAKQIEERVNSPEFKQRIKEVEEKAMQVEIRAKEVAQKAKERKVNQTIEETADNITVTINKNTSDKQIKEYTTQFKSQNIEMKVSNIKRNKNGEITKIKISLSESSGTKDNKKESKVESVFDTDEVISEIFVGKRNGNLTISSK